MRTSTPLIHCTHSIRSPKIPVFDPSAGDAQTTAQFGSQFEERRAHDGIGV